MSLDEVILHVGTGKTGSTSIQYFLLTNRALLLDKGVLAQIPGDFLGRMAETGTVWYSDTSVQVALETITQALETSGAKRLLWSWEALSNRIFSEDVDRLRRIKAAFPAAKYRIIVYLRRQDHWLRSAYLQWGIKDNQEPGPILSFDAWYDRLISGRLRWWRPEDLDYDALLQPWIEVFGRDSLTVRVYEKEQLTEGSAVADFREHSGLPEDPDYVVDIEQVNETFNMELHELIALYSRMTGSDRTPVPLLCYLDESARDPFFRSSAFSKFQLPPRVAVELLERCQPSNARVARELLERPDGQLFRDPLPSLDEPEPQTKTLTFETAVPILIQLVMMEHHRTGQLRQHYQELRAAHQELQTAHEALNGTLSELMQRLGTVEARLLAPSARPTLEQRILFKLKRYADGLLRLAKLRR